LYLFEFVTVEGKCVGIIERQVFFEGVECVPMMLDCTLELSFLGILGGMVVSVMLVSGFVRFIFREGRLFQDHMCRVLKNSEIAAFAVSAKDCGHILLL